MWRGLDGPPQRRRAMRAVSCRGTARTWRGKGIATSAMCKVRGAVRCEVRRATRRDAMPERVACGGLGCAAMRGRRGKEGVGRTE
eukprot:scaffold52690_cov24-Phaeocystis_antarctica.AAC.1